MRETGFGIIIAIITIFLVVVIGLVGLLVMGKKSTPVSQVLIPTPEQTSRAVPSTKPKASPGTKSIITAMGNVTVTYPQQWRFTSSKLAHNGTVVYGRPSDTSALYPKIVIEVVPKSQMTLATRLSGLEKIGFAASQGQFQNMSVTEVQATLPNIADTKQTISSRFTLFEKGDYLYLIGYEAQTTDKNLPTIKDIVASIIIAQ